MRGATRDAVMELGSGPKILEETRIDGLKKSCIFRPGRGGYVKIPPNDKYAIIREMTLRENNLLNISWLCEATGVPRSGYYCFLATDLGF